MTGHAIEETLLTHPDVIEACVLQCSEADAKPLLRAFVVLRDASNDMVHSFCEWCRHEPQQTLNEVEIHVLSALPKTRTGALARRQLVAVIDSSEAWISIAACQAPETQHAQPWVKYQKSELKLGNNILPAETA